MKPTPRTKRTQSPRAGSALVLTLVILFASVGMIAVVQQALFSSHVEQRILDNDVELLAALLLALQDAMRLWADDDDRSFDHPGEAWALRREERTDTGVALVVQLACAQDRFNVNNLTLPANEALPRGPWDMFEDLLSTRETPPSADALRELRAWMAEKAPIYVDAAELGDPFDGPELIAIPRGATGPSTLNLNSVYPAVLNAILGSSFAPWVDSVVRMRTNEPIRNAEAVMRMLPPAAAVLLQTILDTRTEFAEFRAEAFRDHTTKTLKALLRRDAEGAVEILSCRW